MMALRTEEAYNWLKKEQQQHPDNLLVPYLEDYGDCLQLLFNGNVAEYDSWKHRQDERLSLMETGDRKSPWYLFSKANINLHWALVHLRFGDNFIAGIRFRKSFMQLKENKRLFPHFEEQNVLLGLEQCVAGAIPEQYKWLGNLIGLKGDVNKGITVLAQYLNAHQDGNTALYEEAMIYYVYLKFYLQSAPETAWKFVTAPGYNESGNLMRCFVKANLALNYRKADIAYDILTKAASTEGYEQFPIFQYECAEALLHRLDFNCAGYYSAFLKNYKGRHFIPDAWMKMAWVAYLQGNSRQASYFLQQIRRHQNVLTDADKQARRFAEQPTWPLTELLKVRLLIDGGMYKKALAQIQAIRIPQLTRTGDLLEYHFRYGRIFEELQQYDKALSHYTTTVSAGRNERDYYAARAALHKGLIYERNGKPDEAAVQFNDCLSMRNHDFQSSIDQLAKAGLSRLGKR